MKRRDFLSFLLGVAAAWPQAAMAQPGTVRRIGFLGANTPAAAGHLTIAFVSRLQQLGWVQGKNLEIEFRWAAGQTAKFREFAAELAAAGVDVIVTTGNAPAIAARHATRSIPIVLASTSEIMTTGLVDSLARPGGNVTGLTFSADDTVGKRFELLLECVPSLRRLAVLFNPDSSLREIAVLRQEALTRGVALDTFEFRAIGDLEQITRHPERASIGALYVVSDPSVFTNRIAINDFATREKLPTVHRLKEYVTDGGLISYGPDFAAFFRRAADYVDKIFKGARPEDLPIEQPTFYQLVINLKTAKAIGVAPPATMLARADDVIE
jgi:putative ABC transport system substrate-binding protein